MKRELIEHIAASGPVPFEWFMDRSLYGPAGFFATSELRSVRGGDFLTSPEVSSQFGETIAAFVEAEYDRIGEPFEVIEVAGGSGSLVRSLRATLGEMPISAVDVSPAAQAALADILGPERVSDRFRPQGRRGVVLANELLDNLPMALAQITDGIWRERWVGVDDGSLCFVDVEVRPEVARWLDRFAGPVDDGGWVEVQLEAFDWVRRAVSGLDAGCVLLFDYGDTMENLAPRRRDGTLRTYRAHHLGPHPLDEPGATDITADVNFTAVAAAAIEAGADVEVQRQDDFLADWGLRSRISDMRHRELELAREGHEMHRLKIRTVRQDAETLMHPRGLGDFRVLVARK